MGIFAPVQEPTVEQRDWLTDDTTMWEGPLTASGARVNQDSAMRLSTTYRCVSLITNAIATMPVDLAIKLGPIRFTIDRAEERPLWMSHPYPPDPSMTWMEHAAQVTTSLLLDGNFFTFVPGGIFDPSVLMLLDPRRVEVKASSSKVPYYIITNAAGQKIAEVDPMRMLHGTWLRMPGALRGMSPIEAARQTIGAGLATEDFAARFFGQGAALSFGVEYPGHLTTDQQDTLREQMKKNYSSSKKSHSIGVLTDGAKFVTGLGITNEQAQFLETQKFNKEQIGMIYGVPPHMLGSQEPGASSYNSTEIRGDEFREYCVLHYGRRIADAYQRLVEVPDRLQGSNASAQFSFNFNVIAQANQKARYEAYGVGIEKGFLTPGEARAKEDLPPKPGDEHLYMQQQMVPLGTMPVVVPQVTRPVRPALSAGGE